MKLPTWFKLIWWIVVTGLTAWLFWQRVPAIKAGNSVPVDVFVFLVLVALVLAPIFQEISFFGLSFKQAIDEMKSQISSQLTVFKAEIQSSIVNSNNINVTIPAPPPDDQLPGLESRITSAISEALMWPTNGSLPSGSKMNWHAANHYCSTLNYNGFADWRLPTRLEFRFLSEYVFHRSQAYSGDFSQISQSGGINPFFAIHDDGGYWVDEGGIYPEFCRLGHAEKQESLFYVWPVRGP